MNNTDGLPSGFFWLLTVIGVMNIFLVVVHIVRQTDFYVLLTLATTLLAVVITWICLARLRNGLSKLSDGADGKLVGRLKTLVQTLYLMGNLGILSLLSFVPKTRSF